MNKGKVLPSVRRKILVCSRYSVTVAGLRALVAEPAGFSLTECSDVAGLRSFLTLEMPELLLIDVGAGITLEFLGEIRTFAPATGVILWTDGISPEFVRHAIYFGIRGVLRKDASIEDSIRCVTQVADGELWLDAKLSGMLLCAQTVTLTPREGQIIGLLTQGLKNKEIAWRMKITEGTAKAYLSSLYKKTGANDRFELALFAVRNLTMNVHDTSDGKPEFSIALADRGLPGFVPATLATLKPSRDRTPGATARRSPVTHRETPESGIVSR